MEKLILPNGIVLAKGCDYHDVNPVNGFQFGSINNEVTNQIEVTMQKNIESDNDLWNWHEN